MENSNSNTNTLDTTKSVSVRCQSGSTNTWGGSAEFDVFFVKAQVNYSHTTTKDNEVTFTISRSWKNDRGFTRNCNSDSKRGNSRARGKNHNQTNGKSKTRRDGGSTTVTNGHSESDSTETRRGDSTSDAWSNGGSQSRGWSVSNSDMYGGSQSHQVGSSSERGRVDSYGGDSSKAYTFTTDKSFDHGSSNTTTRTLETSQTINIPGDSCGIPICRVMVESIITPWACKTDEPDEFNIYTTELQFLPPEMANSMQVKCILQMAPCKPTLPGFELLPSIYTATEAQPFAFRSGAIFLSTSTEMSIKSKNGEYSLQFVQSATGYSNLAVIRFNSPKPVWETGIKGLGESRFYISDDGHLIQEGKGVYSNSPDEWTKVWSNQPLNLNFPVGVRKERGYTLFLNDIGELELYDGALIRIWSSTKSKNKLGYKYPTSNIYPSVYPTEPNAAGQVDPHNSIPTGIVWKKDNFIGKNCTAILRQNEGIVSQNGRFRLYLRETGNLVIRDGPRLMWETSTADLWYAKGPFRAIIGPEGYFQVKDSQNAIIWQTEGQGLQRVEVGDDGNLAGFGPDGERWSLRVKENVPFSGWIVFKHPYLHCDDCIDCVVNAPVNPLVNLASGKY
ncbi:hypothetical protein BC833DRAFT_285268 [Globomyces pollinis-pini]|nr:hypothetical protein BC833DRAFT_285268 [Globomyces pollinis-pini]